jgi:hypothetical protein
MTSTRATWKKTAPQNQNAIDRKWIKTKALGTKFSKLMQ